jgi:hypothetical protein
VRAALATLAFVAGVIAAPLSANAQSYEERLWFYPEVPTAQSTIKAIVSLAAPTPCHRVEMQDAEVSLNNIYLHVQVAPPAEGTVCAQVLQEHTLVQEIGRLDAGLYYVRLYVNGEMKVLSQLNVVESDVAILSTGRYSDEQTGTVLVGEVRNEGERPLELVQIDISFYLGQGSGRNEHTFTTMAVLMPGMTSGFAFPLLDEASQQAEYTLNTDTYRAAEPKEQALHLTVEPVHDAGTIKGIVVNSADRMATQVKIVCAAYDEQGRIIDSVFDYAEPADIAPGQSADFETPLTRSAENFNISCNAESIVFSTISIQVVPEFPAAMIALAGSLAGLVLYRFRNKL